MQVTTYDRRRRRESDAAARGWPSLTLNPKKSPFFDRFVFLLLVEELIANEGLPWTSFRPQYIYGPKTNKRDYLDYFFDRIVREKPVPIPNS